MKEMKNDLKDPIRVPLTKIFFDPNNPRIAPDERLGYEDPERVFDPDVQADLFLRIQDVYDVESLEEAIVEQGWVPIDAILVWEHPKKKGHYIVVEGNTRTAVLRRIRERLDKAANKLARMEKKVRQYPAAEIAQQRDEVKALKKIVSDTEELKVVPVDAATPEELEAKLPRLLGVRHIKHAQQWKPYAENRYILSLYTKLFREKYGDKVELNLEPDKVQKVAKKVSLSERKTRQRIQTAAAFGRFRRHFEDKLPQGETFRDDDQYYFQNILEQKYPAEQFEFGTSDLHLSEEMEEVLFKWAFSKPRPKGDNPNILRIAEDTRLWDQIKQFDDRNQTSFHTGLDVSNPDAATPMEKIEADYLERKVNSSPVNTVERLLDKFRKLPADALTAQASFLRPMIQELKDKSENYLKMLNAVSAR
jgi:hypothetical protein